MINSNNFQIHSLVIKYYVLYKKNIWLFLDILVVKLKIQFLIICTDARKII